MYRTSAVKGQVWLGADISWIILYLKGCALNGEKRGKSVPKNRLAPFFFESGESTDCSKIELIEQRPLRAGTFILPRKNSIGIISPSSKDYGDQGETVEEVGISPALRPSMIPDSPEI